MGIIRQHGDLLFSDTAEIEQPASLEGDVRGHIAETTAFGMRRDRWHARRKAGRERDIPDVAGC